MERELDRLYREIVKKVNESIPEPWNRFCFYAQISNTGGGVYFYYKSEQYDDFIYSLDIPELFEVDKDRFKKKVYILYKLSKRIWNIFRENQQAPWYSFTICLNDQGDFKINYDYTNWFETEYSFNDQLVIWKYKYLNIMPKDEDEQNTIERYLIEYPTNPV